jgi:integrase
MIYTSGIAPRYAAQGVRLGRPLAVPGDGPPFCAIAELLGHSSLQTTMIYTHVLNRGGLGVTSPADRL